MKTTQTIPIGTLVDVLASPSTVWYAGQVSSYSRNGYYRIRHLGTGTYCDHAHEQLRTVEPV